MHESCGLRESACYFVLVCRVHLAWNAPSMKEYLAGQNVNARQATVDRKVSAKRVRWQHLKSTLVI